MNVVVVESPAKAKTINKYLGGDYQVLASFGHVRDLPSKNGSVDPEQDFAMTWEVDSKSQKHVKAIADAVKGADKLILATDPDREGEAISWHLLEVLAKRRALKDIEVQRVVFNAITKSAVLEAMSHPRNVDMELVEAYLARRALDYLVGFTLSPVLWRKLPGARSAGRVQSVALRLITDREMEIEAFKAIEYWSVEAEVRAAEGAGWTDPFAARLVTLDGKKLDKHGLGNEAAATAAVEAITRSDFSIESVEAKPTKRNPAPPFTTSTLQQEAARKLGFSADRTMRVAQRLYEGVDIGGETTGLITYMRTDGVQMAPEALSQAREAISARHGDSYLPEKPRYYSTKAKNAQEAHEAIRPTSFMRHPDGLHLEADQKKLYGLIWRRAIASQMAAAEIERTTIEIVSSDKQTGLRATGSVITFDGFIAIYREGLDDADDEDAEGRLPKVSQGAAAKADKVKPEQHFTQPPPRFTEASLVKEMEKLGIGRPSTYASILSVLRDREYVRMEQNRFHPEDKGRLVTMFLENFFKRYVEYDFTAALEEKLDKVSAGELSWKALLEEFWRDFSAATSEISELRIAEVIDKLDEALGPHVFPEREDGADPRKCPSCDDGRLSLKIGKFGAFAGCSNYPECKYTRPLGVSEEEAAAAADTSLGADPDTGLEVFLKTGRFGPYVQLGEEDKPKRQGLPKGWSPADVNLEKALQLLALPREVGPHPEDGKMITAGIGRYGPFVLHDGTYANLKDAEEVFEIGLNRAVTVIAEKRANPGRGRGRAAAKPARELGEHPTTGKPIGVYDGRYGPYVKHEKTNATLPKDLSIEEVTLEQAVELIDAKAAKGGKKKPAKKAATKKTAKPKAKKKAAAD
ncbi:MAG: type I DNA topoisomerase [Maricaulaceae bacterium]|jgi:DNA topoisomerase-1